MQPSNHQHLQEEVHVRVLVVVSSFCIRDQILAGTAMTNHHKFRILGMTVVCSTGSRDDISAPCFLFTVNTHRMKGLPTLKYKIYSLVPRQKVAN